MTPQPQAPTPDRERLRLMVVVAHPHDFTHCAGTCGIHSSLGDAVTVVTLTNGATKHNERLYDELIKPAAERDPRIVNQSREDYAREKLREFRAVCGLFGVSDVRVHGFPEPYRMERALESVETLKKIILEVRPDLMISHRRYLRGRSGMVSASRNEHDEAGFATHEAMYLASLPRPLQPGPSPHGGPDLLPGGLLRDRRDRLLCRYQRLGREAGGGRGPVRHSGPHRGLCPQAHRGGCRPGRLGLRDAVCGGICPPRSRPVRRAPRSGPSPAEGQRQAHGPVAPDGGRAARAFPTLRRGPRSRLQPPPR